MKLKIDKIIEVLIKLKSLPKLKYQHLLAKKQNLAIYI